MLEEIKFSRNSAILIFLSTRENLLKLSFERDEFQRFSPGKQKKHEAETMTFREKNQNPDLLK